MRRDLDLLQHPLEVAKHARRRAALRSRFAAASLLVLVATVALVLQDGGRPLAAFALFGAGAAIIGYHLGQLARMPDPVPPGWLCLAIETRLSTAGRDALTTLLMAPSVSCDAALDWARVERERTLDDAPRRDPVRHLAGR